MSDNNQCSAILARKAKQQIDDCLAGFGVEVAGGFIGEDDAGIVDEGSGDGDPLLLSAAEFGGQVVLPLCEANTLEELTRFVVGIPSGDHGRDLDVFQCGELREEEVTLKNKTHTSITKAGQLVIGEGIDALVFEDDLPGFGAFQTSQCVKEGCFARARGSAKKDGFPPTDRNGDATQDLYS